MNNDLRCYVCGNNVKNSFRLVSMSENVDRVFIVGNDCLEQVQDDAKIAVLVERIE